MRVTKWALVLVGVFAVGCGDAETTDERPLSKAPLEDMDLLIEPEVETEMAELGDPVRQPRLRQDGTPAGPDEQGSKLPPPAPAPAQPAAASPAPDTSGAGN